MEHFPWDDWRAMQALGAGFTSTWYVMWFLTYFSQSDNQLEMPQRRMKLIALTTMPISPIYDITIYLQCLHL